ncbi:hypothetical protein ACFQ2B_12290 [Streptomyces stramineus]|uniref:Small secreted protein n=1 Tax=Streptomyces stramineus TaxID=173861 RepID=A0ABN1AG06_9ACTN
MRISRTISFLTAPALAGALVLGAVGTATAAQAPGAARTVAQDPPPDDRARITAQVKSLGELSAVAAPVVEFLNEALAAKPDQQKIAALQKKVHAAVDRIAAPQKGTQVASQAKAVDPKADAVAGLKQAVDQLAKETATGKVNGGIDKVLKAVEKLVQTLLNLLSPNGTSADGA